MGKDHYGNTWNHLDANRPKASLLKVMCRKSAVPMYRDTKAGTVQVGYVVAPTKGSGEVELWVELFAVNPWKVP